MNPVKDLHLLLEYFKLIRKIKPQLIISYTIKPNLYGCTIARLMKIPYAINITGLGTAFQKDDFLKKLVIIWYKFVCKKSKTVFFENVGNRDIFIKDSIVEENKCCVLNGAGVNLDDFYFEEYPKDENVIHYLFIGRIMKEKGIEELFQSITKLHDEYGDHVVLDVLGNYEDNYREVIDNLVNKNIIHYYGYQEDVRPFIKKCHCFALPSYHEGMANTLLEAASMGRPLITSNIHGCKEAVESNGYLVNIKDADDLYMRLKDFIELSYEEKVIMARNSRIRMERVFDKKKVVESTMKGLGL